MNFNVRVHSSYDYEYYNYTYNGPNAGYTPPHRGHAEENQKGQGIFFSLCLRADYFIPVSRKNSLVIGARLTGLHKYAYYSYPDGYFWDANFNLSAGITF